MVEKLDIPDIGIVEVTVINRFGKGGSALAIHGMKSTLVHEWVPAAEHFSSALDLQVYIPNLHSNRQTKPGSRYAFKALNYVIDKFHIRDNMVLMGKSWGTAAA